jgi:hypothetical protein
MIQRLLKLLGGKTPEEKQDEVVPIDPNNIYVRLKLAIDRVGSTSLRLGASPASLGRIESFSETLTGLLKSLLEVNATLKENKHIERGLFFIKNAKTVKFDKFLFVEDGYYVDDVPARMQLVLEQIDIYYELMKEADRALYGVMEHNHRQLHSYTETLIQFLTSLFDHFGD